jgi:tRNA-dependent cyclodipeptide synthase
MAKAKASGAKSQWQNLTGGKGYMGISLDSSNHTGEGLAAMVDWINSQGHFEQFLVGLSDTLNTHNYAHDLRLSPRAAFTYAMQKGNKWLEENEAILESLEMPFSLVRWAYWQEHFANDVADNQRVFEAAYRQDIKFREAVNADIARFLKRKTQNPDASAVATCGAYLIEELAVYSVILKSYPGTVIYPGKQLECMRYVREQKPAHLPASIGETGYIRLSIHGLNREPPLIGRPKAA